MEQNITTLQQWIDESDNIVFFGGAGVSTESGIPDFRSVGALYHQSYAYPRRPFSVTPSLPKTPGNSTGFIGKNAHPGAQPNAAHRKLAELEQAGKLKAVVTQNIDGLHQAAGSKVVYELHGSTPA